MPEQRQADNGDRLDNLDLLRDALLGDQTQDYQTKIDDLENQINWVRDEMRAQGDEVQHVLDQKINEVLQAIQVSQFGGTQPPATKPAPNYVEPPTTEQIPEASPVVPHYATPPAPATNPLPQAVQIPQEEQPPAPEVITPPEPPAETLDPPAMDFNLDDFSQQINAILGSPPAIAPPPPQTPPQVPQIQASPPPPPVEMPPPQVQNFPVVTEEEATQRQNLRNFLADKDVIQLRQMNHRLDDKLRQVEESLATSQQPRHDLLPLMTELVQLKVQEAKSVELGTVPQMAQPKIEQPQAPVLQPRSWKMIFSFVLLLLLIPLGFYGYWLRRAFVLERDVAIAWHSTPELSLYRLNPDVKRNTLYLTGKVPSQTLSDRAAEIAQGTVPTLTIKNHILVVEALLDPAQKQTEIDKVLNPLNAINGIQVESELAGDRLTLNGTVIKQADIDVVIAAVEQINGISQVINNIKVEVQPISTQLYFDQNSTAVKPDDRTNKLEIVKTFLTQHPDLNVRITGYQHPSESATNVALKRAQITQILLQDQGIDRRRIIALGVNQSPPQNPFG